MKQLPTIVLSGFLGSGKTTLLNRILHNRNDLKVAIIVNDMSSVNIDAALVNNQHDYLAKTDEKMVELSNGCICCTLREDLLKEVKTLAEAEKYDYLLIESTGISEPLPVATTFDFRDSNGFSLADISYIDNMVTVVDAVNFFEHYYSTELLRNTKESRGEDDQRAIIDLMVEQIEFASTIILNKISDCSPQDLVNVKAVIKGLNPEAKLLETNFCDVPLEEILATKRFDLSKAQSSPIWVKELNGFKDHVPETEEYGITSFVYNARLPFNPEMFMNFINEQNWPGVVRAKGFFWLSTRTNLSCELSLAGKLVRHQIVGQWWATVNKKDWPNTEQFKNAIAQVWDEKSGDKRQCIVFIGLKDKLDQRLIEARLNACLVQDYWDDPEKYHALNDPFPIDQLINEKLEEATDLAGELYSQRKIAECVKLFSNVLEFIDHHSGNVHVPKQRSGVLNNLGIAYQELGDFPKAIQYFTEARDINVDLNIQQAVDLINLRLSQCQMKQIESAMKSANQLLAEAKTKYLAKQFDIALDLFTQLLNIYQTQLPEEQDSLATCYYNIGMTHKCLGNYSSACDHLNECLLIRKKIFGESHKKVKSVEKQLHECNALRISKTEPVTQAITAGIFVNSSVTENNECTQRKDSDSKVVAKIT